jgi:outer membrane protein assembly factor BamB
MRDNEQLFKPETVDDQIEHYASESYEQDALFDEQLVQTLQHIYQPPAISAEDRASLTRVKQRIASKQTALYPPSTPATEHVLPIQRTIKTAGQGTQQREPSLFKRTFSLLAAVLIVGLVVGSWAVVTHLAKQPGQAANNNSLDGPQQNVYFGRNHVIYKLDGRTGNIIWQTQLDPRAQELTGGMHVHVFNGAVYIIMSRDIYTLDARTGKARWHTRRIDGYSYTYDTVADGRIYLYGFGANEPGGTFSAVNTQNGAELWHNTTFHTNRGEWFSVVHGTLYVLSDREDFYAFDTATGAERWHFSSTHRPSFYNAPVVENGIVYFSMGLGNHFVALNEKTGRLVWEQQIPAENVFSTFQLVNGIVYVSSSQMVEKEANQYEQSKKISAFDAKTGAIVWTSPPGYTMLDGTPIADGLLIAQAKQNGVLTLNAFRANDGKQVWQAQEACASDVCLGDRVYIMNGTGYLLESNTTKTDFFVMIKSFDWQKGTLLAQKPSIFGSTILGISNGIIYQQASTVSGNGNNQKFTDNIYAIRLADSSIRWQYSTKNLTAGNSGTPGALAP